MAALVGNGLLSQRESLERHRVEPSAGDHRATSALWNLFGTVASAVSGGIARSGVIEQAKVEWQCEGSERTPSGMPGSVKGYPMPTAE